MEEKKKSELLKKLENILHVSDNYSIPYHEDSIMGYDKICTCDDAYLCDHRREWVIDFLKRNLD